MVSQMLSDICFRLGRWYLGLGRMGLGQAHRCLRVCRRLWPAHPQVRPWLAYLEGLNALREGRPDEALEHLRVCARALPEFAPARARVGVALAMLGRDDEAIATLERVLHTDIAGLQAEVFTSLAWSYLRSGRPAQAQEVCRRADHQEIRSPRLHLLYRLAVGVQVGGLPTAELRELVQSIPQSTPLILEYARLQAREGRQRLAQAALQTLPEEFQARALAVLGQASLNEADLATAHWVAEQLAQREELEALVPAAVLRSEVALRRDDLAAARSTIQEAQTRWPENGPVREQASRVLLLGGHWEDALHEAIEALHGGNGGALAAGLAALAALEVGDLDSARGLFLVNRLGDDLACACAHTAQARLASLDEELAEALRLAAWAVDEIESLPLWAARPVVLDHLATPLMTALRVVCDGGEDEDRQLAGAILERLRDSLQHHAQMASAPSETG